MGSLDPTSFIYVFLTIIILVSIFVLLFMIFRGSEFRCSYERYMPIDVQNKIIQKTEIEGYETRFSTTRSIPKVIWTYWSDPEIPESVQLCIDTWRFHNPHYDIVVLNKDKVSDFVDIDIYAMRNVENDVRASDILRLYLLQKHGGVWIDATMICTKPLEWLISEDGNEFIGFFMGSFTSDNRYPVIENWFMACPSESNLIHLVYEEFMRIADFDSIDGYVQDVRDSGVDFQDIPFPEYLAMHIAFQKVLQTSDSFALKIIDARGIDGPFRYLDENDWDSQRALDMLCKENRLKTPLIKLRGIERGLIEEGKASIECFRVEL